MINFGVSPMFGVRIMKPRDVVMIESMLPDALPDKPQLFIDQEAHHHLALAAIMARDLYQCQRAVMRAIDYLGLK